MKRERRDGEMKFQSNLTIYSSRNMNMRILGQKREGMGVWSLCCVSLSSLERENSRSSQATSADDGSIKTEFDFLRPLSTWLSLAFSFKKIGETDKAMLL